MTAGKATAILAVLAYLVAPPFARAQEMPEGGLQAVSLEAARAARRALPFDPMRFEAPALVWEDLPGTQWWAARLVGLVVHMGLMAADDAGPAANLAETLMRRGSLSYRTTFESRPGVEGARLELQVKESRGGPYLNLLLSW